MAELAAQVATQIDRMMGSTDEREMEGGRERDREKRRSWKSSLSEQNSVHKTDG